MRLTEVRYVSSSRIPTHVHGNPHICVVLAGGYVEEIGGLRVDCGPATILYHAAEAAHGNEISNGGARCLNVALDPAALDADPVWARLCDSAAVHRGVPTKLTLRLTEELSTSGDLSALAAESLVMELLAEFVQGPQMNVGGEVPPWLVRVHARLREEFRAPPSLASLATEGGVHRTHLARAFRKHFECSVGEFVRQQKVAAACHELRETRRSLATVAYSAGFADQSHMTRTLRRWVGVTPGHYRRLANFQS